MTTIDPTPARDEHGGNLAFVLIVHLGVGFFWLFALAGIVSVFSESTGVIWGLSAAALWVIDTVRIARARFEPARTWTLTFYWWLKSFVAPFALAVEGLQYLAKMGRTEREEAGTRFTVAAPPPSPPPPPPPPPSAPRPDLTARLDDFARRLSGLEAELRELRRFAAAAPGAEPAPAPVAPPLPPAQPVVQPPPTPPSERPRREEPAEPGWVGSLRRSVLDREITFDDLFGAKALAWVGGIVTLLGIVFFFVLAVNRGWIGPAERVALGAIASLVVFGAGIWLRRAYGGVYSAYAATGAGIAGGYVTLLAATALYDLVSRPVALGLAAGIAAVATGTALLWSSELLAGLGLVGALLAPAAIAAQDGEWSSIGTAFAAVMFAATAAVAVARRWPTLLGIGFVASLVEAGGLVAGAEATDWDVVAVATAFWLLYVGSGIALQLRRDREPLSSLPSTLILAGGVFAGLSGVQLFDGADAGWALLVVAGVEALAAAALFVRPRGREVSVFVGVVALAIGAVAFALILSGPALTIAWSAETVVLAWLARRVRDVRYQVVSLAYLGAAAVHALFWEAPLSDLYRATETPADGIVAVVAVGLAAAGFSWFARPWPSRQELGGIFAPMAPLLDAFADAQPVWRAVTGWTAGLAAIYAASLATLQVAQWSSDEVELAFDWGHVAVTGLWGLVALAALAIGHRLDSVPARLGGLAWLGAVLLQTVFFDVSLGDEPRGYAFLVGGAAVGIGALLDRLSIVDPPAFAIVCIFVVSSIALEFVAVIQLLSGDTENYALLGVAAVYSAAAIAVRRDRDLATTLWAPALAVAGWAASELLSGTWLVLAWAAASAGLAVLANRTGERRLEIPSLAFLALAFLHTLAIEAPLTDLVDANRHPENGVPALLLTMAAAVAFGYCSRLDREWRLGAYAVAALLGIYAGSLAILGLAERVGGASVATDFQRGHSGVSAFWGAIGLAALWVGLRRGARWLRLAGFALFGLALAKLFLYDLAFLSSVTRAFSFLAVGAVLLFGGFLVQKLSAEDRKLEAS